MRPRLAVGSCDANTRSNESEAVDRMQEEAVMRGYEKRVVRDSNGEGIRRRGGNEKAVVQMVAGGSDGDGGRRREGQSECRTTSPVDCVSA